MWNQSHQNVLEAYHRKFGLPAIEPTGDAARAWTFKLAQQFNFSFPTEGWATKRASHTRPPSTDVICTMNPFVGFDVIQDQGIPSQRLNNLVGHHGEDLTGQVVILTPAFDWIGGGTVPTPIPPTPTPTPVKSREVFSREFAQVNAFYAAPEGLQRLGGMVSNVDASVVEVLRKVANGQITDLLTIQNACGQILMLTCDVVSMNQWGYDLVTGTSVPTVIEAIKQSDEWKLKHPGGV